MLTIVMYHYVRELAGSEYPAIKALTTTEFDQQLDFIQGCYTIVGWDELYAAMYENEELPENACLLTFDDGLRDHYVNVLPRLQRRQWTACFFPSSAPVLEHTVLDSHKLHFALAAAPTIEWLVAKTSEELERLRTADPGLPSWRQLREEHSVSSRFDAPDVALLKHALQTVLPLDVRQAIVHTLFTQTVTRDEAGFSANLYMTAAELAELTDAGMTIGGHGHSHERLGLLPAVEQEFEIQATVQLLERVRPRSVKRWCIAYPHGSYNGDTLRLASAYGAVIGFTIEVGVVNDFGKPLELQRLDTNDLPPKGLGSR